MAESASEKTEQATPERLLKAREEGRVPQSEEVGIALSIGVLLVMLGLVSAQLYHYLAGLIQQGMSFRVGESMSQSFFSSLLRAKGGEALLAMTPVLVAVAMVSVLASVLSSGWSFSTKVLAVKFENLSPANGIKTIISWRSVVHMLLSLGKLIAIGIIVWNYLQDKLPAMMNLHWTSPEGVIAAIGQLSLGAMGRVVVALIVIAGADLLYQRWNHKHQLMMTRQEVKDERKQYELPGEVKGKIRSLQTALARKRIARAVPTADVVIVNPTHVAVALKYDMRLMEAPVVVAKGADFMCQTIKDIAAKHGVPIVERPELARALYASVKEGQNVPESLFVAVAEVLAMIYRLGRKRQTREL
jgi:flagellar biosynthesis protein FlhB